MVDLDYAPVVGRFGITVGDLPAIDVDADVDVNPDVLWCDEGTVTLVPLVTQMKVTGDPTVGPFMAGNAPIETVIDADTGRMTYNGSDTTWVLDLGSDKVNPRFDRDVASYRVEFKGMRCRGVDVKFTDFTFHAKPLSVLAEEGKTVNDLALVSPVPATGGTPIVRGPGVISATVNGDGELLLNLETGEQVNAGELPVGPGGSAAGVASYLAPGTVVDTAAGDLVADPASALRTGLNTAFVRRWQPNTAYTAGDLALAPDGTLIERTTTGTSGATYSGANWKTATGLTNVIDGRAVPRWQPNTVYAAGDPVLAPDGSLVKAKIGFTSGAAYSSANWTSVFAYAGTQARTELDEAIDGRLGGASAPTDVGARTGTFDAVRSLYVPDGASTTSIRALVQAAALGSRLTKVAWIGTSIVAGYGSVMGVSSAPVLLRAKMRGYGNVGTGMVPASNGYYLGTVTTLDDARWSLNGSVSILGGPRVSNMQLHLGSATTGRTVTFTSDVPGTEIDLYYFNNSRPFTYSIDGAAAVTVTPPGGSTIGKTTITGLANTTHTVTLTVAGTTGTFYLLGVDVRQPNGIEVAGLGYYGAITEDWLPTSSSSAFFNGHNDVGGYAPDAVLVQLGPNELIHGIAGGAATVKTNLNTIVAAHKAAGRKVALVVDPPIESGTVSGWATTYRSAIYDVADTHLVPLVDLTHSWGSRAQGAAKGYYADQWHPTPAGSAAIANTVHRALFA